MKVVETNRNHHEVTMVEWTVLQLFAQRILCTVNVCIRFLSKAFFSVIYFQEVENISVVFGQNHLISDTTRNQICSLYRFPIIHPF